MKEPKKDIRDRRAYSKEYNAKNRERNRANCKEYYKKHKTEMDLAAKEYRESHKDSLKRYYRKYREENKEKIDKYLRENSARTKARRGKWYEKNRELSLSKNAKWYKENSEWSRAKEAKRKALKNNSKFHFTHQDINNLYISQNGCCACCNKSLNGVFHVDHIYPLSKGGGNGPDNIQLLLPKCNLQKGNKDPEEFMRSRTMV